MSHMLAIFWFILSVRTLKSIFGADYDDYDDQDDDIEDDYQATSGSEGCGGDWVKGGGGHGRRQEGQAGQEDQALVKDQIKTGSKTLLVSLRN